MLSLAKNPFSWKDGGNISGLIGSLSLTTPGGSNIPVEELSKDIEVSTAQLICNELHLLTSSQAANPDSPLDQQKVKSKVCVCVCVRDLFFFFFFSFLLLLLLFKPPKRQKCASTCVAETICTFWRHNKRKVQMDKQNGTVIQPVPLKRTEWMLWNHFFFPAAARSRIFHCDVSLEAHKSNWLFPFNESPSDYLFIHLISDCPPGKLSIKYISQTHNLSTRTLLIGRCAFPDPVAEDQWNAGEHRRAGPGQLQHHGHRPSLRQQHSSAKGANWNQFTRCC